MTVAYLKPKLKSSVDLMIPDFHGHHFLEYSQSDEGPIRHHCDRCGMVAFSRPDGWTDFYVGTDGRFIAVSGHAMLKPSSVPHCK
jgi:hypothetical protein